MKNIFIAFAFLTLVSCTSDPVSSNVLHANNEDGIDVNATDIQTELIIADSIADDSTTYQLLFLLPDEVILLHKYIDDTLIQELDEALIAYTQCESDTVFVESFFRLSERLYRMTDAINTNADLSYTDALGNAFPWYIKTELEFLEDIIPGFKHSCVAECTEYDFDFEIKKIITKADSTEGNLDDKYFAVLALVDSSFVNTRDPFRNWFVRYWDYGGASTLGANLYLNFLDASKTYLTQNNTGKEYLHQLREEVFEDLFHGIYDHSHLDAMEELEQIIEGDFYTKEQSEALESLYAKIASGNWSCTGCVTGQFQFNCKTGDCDIGG